MGHNIVVDEAIPATSTTLGLTEGSHCSICGKVLRIQRITRVFEQKAVINETKQATSTTPGLTQESRNCSCGEALIPQEKLHALDKKETVGDEHDDSFVDPHIRGVHLMIIIIESVILCLLLTLMIYLMSREPIKTLYNYPPRIQERVKSLDEYRGKIPTPKKGRGESMRVHPVRHYPQPAPQVCERVQDVCIGVRLRMLKPNSTGFLVHDIAFYIDENGIDISLPEEKGDTFEVLSEDIRDALEKDQPSLVLDRLHTFSTKMIRDICQKHGIPIAQNSNNYPLHSLVGALASYYKANDVLESDFSEQAIKMSISIFERFNCIRNDQSYAHDNEILNKIEARYVVRVISATISLLNEIESTTY